MGLPISIRDPDRPEERCQSTSPTGGKGTRTALGGWHDFRHTLSTQLLRRNPTKVVSELLGHSSVQTTLSVYQHVETDQFRAPLNEIATELLPDVTKLAASRA